MYRFSSYCFGALYTVSVMCAYTRKCIAPVESSLNKVVAQTPEMAQTPERPLSSFSPIFMWIGISVRNMFIQSNVLESSRIFQNE